jgi:hypothetical protein
MQASAPCKSDPLQYHLDQFPVWGGLRHYSPTPRETMLPTQDGEWMEEGEEGDRGGWSGGLCGEGWVGEGVGRGRGRRGWSGRV